MRARTRDEAAIVARENALRAWLTADRDRLLQEIDGLDIGWGGVQRWATARMPEIRGGLHIDFACGVGTFLAELGWRFPDTEFVGLNIDFAGPHEPIRPLLAEAGVTCHLVQADARRIPFYDRTFDSASCFLGLQDIEIGFGRGGVRAAISEAVRVLRRMGTLTLIDEYSPEQMDDILRGSPVRVEARGERKLGVRWNRAVAEQAIRLYTDGWVDQTRLADPQERERVRRQVIRRMRADMEAQFASKGYFVPFGPARLIVARKTT